MDEQGNTEVAKRNNGPARTGPLSLPFLHELGKEVEVMLRLNMRFNLAIRLHLRRIAALFYLFR
jgi:hypothetical protein